MQKEAPKNFVLWNSLKPDMLPHTTQSGDAYVTSHRAIESSRPASITLPRAVSVRTDVKGKIEPIVQSTSDSTQQGAEEAKRNLAELLFRDSANASLLLHESSSRRTSSSRGPTPSRAETTCEVMNISPEDIVTSLRLNVAENEARDRRLAENENRRVELEAELEDLKEEAVILKNALQQSKYERWNLRSSLSKRDLALLQLGQDLVQGGKRLLFDDSDEE
ncbi:uncharacterized protein EKO05_0002754 [Ascochyta rabiei]|uniref:uncharacterized protein n=1 Tax=Didymella rabiei TaxID=5454 RepID=UPI00220A482D|nr:uncharacterized protein EKO05_0002754 [Ascochyta rabiei]UPX12191.1 hypothetical protein EKO05_0002754 [Ascochyta rabiei]